MRERKSYVSPIYMIVSGTARVVMVSPGGEEIDVLELRSGECFGVSDLLKIIVSKLNLTCKDSLKVCSLLTKSFVGS